MTEPFLAEIRIFPYSYAPKGWAFCDGQLMPIRQNTALFSLVGVMYGGDGKTSFALPNLQGNVPMSWGQGPGLSEHVQGETGGTTTVTLSPLEMPVHTHTMLAFSLSTPSAVAPTGELVADGVGCKPFGSSNLASNTLLHPQAVSSIGGSGAHNNMMPSLVLNFCIALQGVFPQRP